MRKIISLILTAIMILSTFSCLTVVSFAADTEAVKNVETVKTEENVKKVEPRVIPEPEVLGCDEDVIVSSLDTFIEDDIFVAEIVSDTTCMITEVKETDDFNGVLNIPGIIEGFTVVGIEDGVFDDLFDLVVVNLPATFSMFSEGIFYGCYYLKEINVPETNKKFASVNGVLYNKAYTKILWYPYDFTGNFIIKAGVTKIPENALGGMDRAASVKVESGNNNFAVSDGVLYNKDYTKIYKAFSIDSDYVMKSTVKEFDAGAFSEIENLKSIKFSPAVTKIAYGAFWGCRSLSSVTLPKSLVSIEPWAFSCTNLTEVNLPSSTKSVGTNAFYCTESLRVVNLNEGLESLGDSVFWGCDVRKVVLPDSLTKMGSGCFYINENLSSVSIGSGLREIPENTFLGCLTLTSVTIPKNIVALDSGSFAATGLKSISLHNKITSISGAFCSCNNLTKVTVPDSVVSMDTAFSWCENLSYAYVGKSVKTMNGAFSGCEKLKKVDLAEGVSGSADEAFCGCVRLQDIDLPSTVTELSYGQFWGCEQLDSFDIPANLYKVESIALENTGWYNNKSNGRVYLEHVFYTFKGEMPANYTLELKKGTKSIAESALANRTNLVKVKLPYGLEYIGDYAFDGCTNLTSIIIPSSVTYIGEYSLGYSYNRGDYIVKHKNFTIYGTENSAAQKYAKANGFTFKVMEKHISSDWILVKKATVNAPGSQHKECTVCGKVLQTKAIPQLKPATPKLSKVTNTANGVKVTWGKVSGADNYLVYRRVYNAKTKSWSDWARIAKVTSTSYVDKTAKTGTYYFYTVKGNNEAGFGGHSAGLKIFFLATPKVTGVSNTASGEKVSWGKVGGAKDYDVYRRTYNAKTKKWSGWTLLKENVRGTAFVDKTAKSGVYYIYTVKANNGAFFSGHSSGLKAYFLSAPKLSKVTSAKSGVTFSWGKVTGASGYIVYRKTGSGDWKKLATVKGNTKVSFLDKSAKKGTTYAYTVKAVCGDYKSAHNTKGLAIKDKY